jgi:hypothetical protein
MKKFLKTLISTGTMIGMLVGSFGMASVTSKIVTIPATSSAWTYYSATRSGNYSYVSARCATIYGNKSSIATAVFNSSMNKISGEYVLTANNSASATFTSVKINEGYLTVKNIYLGFHGLTDSTTGNYKADVKYNPN